MYFPVEERLTEFLGLYYGFSTDQGVHQPICAELGNIRFLLSGGGEVSWPDGRCQAVHPVSTIGPTMSAYAVGAAPGTRLFGIGIQPYGWDAIFGFSASELTNRIEDFPACLDPPRARLVREAHQRMCAADSFQACVGIANTLFARLVEARLDNVHRFPAPLEEWLLRPDLHSLDDLVEMLDVSRRQTDRLAKYYFGASPKALERKYRALHALSRMSLEGITHWWDAAGDGYYDQSHFIREFKTFVGATPKKFLGNTAVLMSKSIELRARATHKRALAAAPARATSRG